jgi:AcrR family transcriptional regulator
MPRPIHPERLGQIVATATSTFIALGYRRTQMVDIAEALGVAKGTLYGYVESKDALFDAAVRYADGHNPLPGVAALPLGTPAPHATVQHVRERLAAEAQDLALTRILAARGRKKNVAHELEAIVSDLFRRISRNRNVIKLVDRCAVDHPELARVWFGEGRWAQHELLRTYLERRARHGLRPGLDAAVVARTILETVAFWAMHRHWDPSPQPVDEAGIERTVVDLLLHGVVEVHS